MVGHYFVVFGGFHDGRNVFRKEIVNRKAYLWSIKRQKWIQGFQFDKGYGGNMCGVSISDKIGVFFGQQQREPYLPQESDLNLNHLAKFVLNMKDGKWVEKDKHFHDLQDLPYYDLNPDLACASVFSKTLEL